MAVSGEGGGDKGMGGAGLTDGEWTIRQMNGQRGGLKHKGVKLEYKQTDK